MLAAPVAKRLVDRVRDPEAGALSLREIEVLREVASGHTNAVIADHLHISQATVKTHLLHIYDKLAVSDRAAAVAVAYESGILTSGSTGCCPGSHLDERHVSEGRRARVPLRSPAVGG